MPERETPAAQGTSLGRLAPGRHRGGAQPGHTRQEIGSGIGFVDNVSDAFMLENSETTVVRAPFAPAPRGLFIGSPSLFPRPPYFVTKRTGHTALEDVTRFTTAPGLAQLPAVFTSALHG